MDSRSLQTASLYINNLLLARGLLRNGAPIEFAIPAKAEGGADATMAKVMNLVHDLILKRDREADNLSSLSQNLQHLRATSTQQSQTISRLENRNADLDRQSALAGAQERAARATLRSAETRTRALKEEMARLKLTVAQIRGQCANDVRRRDGEIARLKKHLEGRRGREGNGGQVGVVVVTPSMNKERKEGRDGESGVDVFSPEYSLKQESTEFLTQLSQGLSDENDALIGLIKNTLATLKSLQGLPEEPSEVMDGSSTCGNRFPDSQVDLLSYETLATNVDEVLEHLRSLLTNPSFVPLEEVEIREEEIIRLREGWVKMEARWREAVALMDGWRKRMMSTGDTINLEDLQMGIKLETNVSPAPNQQGSPAQQEAEADRDIFGLFGTVPDSLKTSAQQQELPGIKSKGQPEQLGEGLFSSKKALRQSSGNARRSMSPRKVSFTTIPEEDTRLIALDADADKPETSLNESTSKRGATGRSPPQSSRRATASPRLTVPEKLASAKAEAEDVRNRRTKGVDRKSVARSSHQNHSRRRSTLSPDELEGLLGYT